MLSVIAVLVNEGTLRSVAITVLVILLVALAVGRSASSRNTALAARANIVQILASLAALGLLVYGLVV